MARFKAQLTPEQFEIAAEEIVSRQGAKLQAFQVSRRETLSADDGEYEIDVTARFEALGLKFLVLIECKNHKAPIKREVVQILNDRLRALGAQKGVLIASSRFQSGAVKYAEKHNIALILLMDGSFRYIRHGLGGQPSQPGTYVPTIASLRRREEGGDRVSYTVMDHSNDRLFLKALGIAREN